MADPNPFDQFDTQQTNGPVYGPPPMPKEAIAAERL
jgi:hypothetical protein